MKTKTKTTVHDTDQRVNYFHFSAKEFSTHSFQNDMNGTEYGVGIDESYFQLVKVSKELILIEFTDPHFTDCWTGFISLNKFLELKKRVIESLSKTIDGLAFLDSWQDEGENEIYMRYSYTISATHGQEALDKIQEIKGRINQVVTSISEKIEKLYEAEINWLEELTGKVLVRVSNK